VSRKRLKFGRWEVIERLAVGGMAEVWHAEAPGESPSVLKRIRPALAQDRALVDAFTQEARLALRLSHPHVVRAIEMGEREGAPFLVLERVDGRDLVAMVRAGKGARLDPGMGALIVARVCRALDYLLELRGID
jgi:serine/threonine-protein kinase